jgi:hypothetical protein
VIDLTDLLLIFGLGLAVSLLDRFLPCRDTAEDRPIAEADVALIPDLGKDNDR